MKKILLLFILCVISLNGQEIIKETKTQKDARMQWWSQARFGMFIHWGLYAIPAGEWKGQTDHAEWIRETAQIPLEEYDKFLTQFNPVKFNPDEWVRMAKDAGMKYIVITSKHHDGFCLFDSKYTDFDVTSTPFKRDILKELADACRKEEIKMCFYHSIMDWHHPDYLPSRTWETNRSTEGADFNRFVQYLKNQLKEIITNYGDIGVLWFDGEWEETWTQELGDDLYDYVRSLDKNIIVNNRVSKGREGMAGLSKEGAGAGDFGTPEQEIPKTGLPEIDWESCITMNDHWGYNKLDKNFKSTKYILQMLSDIASKGGNLLLNVGPTAEGLFPDESIERLAEIGKWMKVNGEAIYGTQASPFKELSWGRCTQKQIDNGTRLYLHIFDWQNDGKLFVPGITNSPENVYLLSDKSKKLKAQKDEGGIIINIPSHPPDENVSVVVLEITGKPEIINPPVIETEPDIFVNTHEIKITSENKGYEIRYAFDGDIPTNSSPVYSEPISISKSTVITAKLFKDGKAVSPESKAKFKKVEPLPSINIDGLEKGIKYKYFEGEWDLLPDFSKLKSIEEGIISSISLSPAKVRDKFGFEFAGYINILEDGAYIFYTESDDGSRLFIDDKMVVDNDDLHSMDEKNGIIALKAGYHSIRVIFFERTGGDGLRVSFKIPGKEKEVIPETLLFHKN